MRRHRGRLLHKARGGFWTNPPAEQAWCLEVLDDSAGLWRPRGDIVGTFGEIARQAAISKEEQMHRPWKENFRAFNLMDERVVVF